MFANYTNNWKFCKFKHLKMTRGRLSWLYNLAVGINTSTENIANFGYSGYSFTDPSFVMTAVWFIIVAAAFIMLPRTYITTFFS